MIKKRRAIAGFLLVLLACSLSWSCRPALRISPEIEFLADGRLEAYLVDALARGDLEEARRQLELGADPNRILVGSYEEVGGERTLVPNHLTPLMFVAIAGYADGVSFLLAAGADPGIEARDINSGALRSSLHLSVECPRPGATDALKLMLDWSGDLPSELLESVSELADSLAENGGEQREMFASRAEMIRERLQGSS